MNAIHLQVNGEMILKSPLRRLDASAREADAFYEVRTRAYNTIVVADRDHMIDAQGSILAAEASERFRWVCADASNACGENVRFIRHVVMLLDRRGVGRAVLILDELTNGVPERVDLFWHTGGQIAFKEGASTGVIHGGRSDVHFAMAGTAGKGPRVESHPLSAQESDHVIIYSAGVAEKACFASVFSTQAIASLALSPEGDGGLSVCIGPKLAVRFAPDRGHLTPVAPKG
jgi:hypothetical protein